MAVRVGKPCSPRGVSFANIPTSALPAPNYRVAVSWSFQSIG